MKAISQELIMENKNKEQVIVYPKTLMKNITDENGNRLDNTLSDIQNQLDKEIDPYFMTEEGYGGLRFLNGKFQYYDEASDTWIDTTVGPENIYVIQIIPKEMTSIKATYDKQLGYNKLRWEESTDTIIDGQVICTVDKVIIRRKLGSVPTDETDGDLVIEVPRSQFGKHKDTYYIDEAVIPVDGDTYYYKAFPRSTMGHYNDATVNETSATYERYTLFGFRIDQTESDPASMITYIADNEDFQSAYMDYENDTFNYGDWTVENGAWFMDVKPCMLNYDGTVAYYLNPNDYTKKIDGTASDVANTSFEGNVMIEFPKVYYKCVNISDDIAEYYFSDAKLDDEYHCWSHIDANGNEIDYCYMRTYNGVNINSILRSLSSQTLMIEQSKENEITYALANNKTDDVIWFTEVFADRQLVNLLLMLIGKSTNTQSIFGNGNYNGGTNASKLLKSGILDNKGLFYGTNGSTDAVKVFGMENLWGNQWQRIVGLIVDKGTMKIKMTYGQSDGSTVDGYNTDGTGYVSLEGYTPSGNLSGGYISKMKFTEYGLIPTIMSGSATTYYCDSVWWNNSQVCYLSVGGCSFDGICIGAFALAGEATGWHFTTSISCKPLATN